MGAQVTRAALLQVLADRTIDPQTAALLGRFNAQLEPLRRVGETLAQTIERIIPLQEFGRAINVLGGVFSRVGSREQLQCAVLEAYDRRFAQAVILPAQKAPAGLERLKAMLVRWAERMGRDVEGGGAQGR